MGSEEAEKPEPQGSRCLKMWGQIKAHLRGGQTALGDSPHLAGHSVELWGTQLVLEMPVLTATNLSKRKERKFGCGDYKINRPTWDLEFTLTCTFSFLIYMSCFIS